MAQVKQTNKSWDFRIFDFSAYDISMREEEEEENSSEEENGKKNL